MPRYYSTVEEAAAEALRAAAANDISRNEWGGLIFSNDQGFFYSDPTMSEKGVLQLRVGVPQGAKPAGIYHTHPRRAHNEGFSPEDIQMAKALGVPSYIHEFRTGGQRAYTPGQTKVRRSGTNMGDALIAPVTIFPEDVPKLKALEKQQLMAEVLREP